MDEYLAFASDLARQAGKLIKDNFEANLQVDLKTDRSPVTHVDKQINSLVIGAIRKKYPEHGILGEEESLGVSDEEFKWICDPLDGTAAFIVGIKMQTFILGLSKDGHMLLSVVYNPFEGTLYRAARGQGAFCNDEPVHVNEQALNGGYVIVEETGYKLFDGLWSAGAVLVPSPCAGYRATLLVRGRCSAIVQAKADNHDVGPASLIIEEAGGKVTLFDGTTPPWDQPIQGGLILSNGACHDELLSVLGRQK